MVVHIFPPLLLLLLQTVCISGESVAKLFERNGNFSSSSLSSSLIPGQTSYRREHLLQCAALCNHISSQGTTCNGFRYRNYQNKVLGHLAHSNKRTLRAMYRMIWRTMPLVVCIILPCRYIADSKSCSLMDIGRVGYFMETAEDIVSGPAKSCPDLLPPRKMSTQRLGLGGAPTSCVLGERAAVWLQGQARGSGGGKGGGGVLVR